MSLFKSLLLSLLIDLIKLIFSDIKRLKDK